MLRSHLLAFLLVASAGAAPALARDCRCNNRQSHRSCTQRFIQSQASSPGENVNYWGYPPLRNASPQDPSGRIVLDGAGGE